MHSPSTTLTTRTTVPALLLLVVSLVTGACNSNRPPTESTERIVVARGLELVQPADIAVAPIQIALDTEVIPAELLRTELCLGLLERRYSPLDLAWVDSRVVEASYAPGEAPPDALLVVTILGWDASELTLSQTLTAKVRVRLFDGGTTDGELLYGSDIVRRMRLQPPGRGITTATAFHAEAARRIALEITGDLPERDPARAPR
jgi:hypothetical protein